MADRTSAPCAVGYAAAWSGSRPAPAHRATLEKVLTVEEGELAVAAARALGVMGAGASETRLVAALDRDVPGLRPEIAEALDLSGTVDTVLAPREAAARYREGEFPRLARNAIAAIQARAAGAEHGQVSVAQPALEEGRLSLPADEAGRLSVPVDAACRLSEPGRRTRG